MKNYILNRLNLFYNNNLLNIIQAKNGGKEFVDEFIKQFRDKYGITEKDYDDKKLKEQIKKGKKEIDILIIILKHIKYLK